MKSYQVLLFDADGTLFDYDRAEATALEKTFEQFNVPWQDSSLATYREINHEIWSLLEQGKIDPDDLSRVRFANLAEALVCEFDPQAFSDGYLRNLGNCTFLIENAESVLHTLAPHYRLAILTNGLVDVQRSRLSQSTIYGYIDELIISGDVGVAKPDQAIFSAALSRLGDPPKDAVLMIGDSISSDITGAVNFGIDSCWYNPNGSDLKPDLPITYEIEELCELLPILI